jgi:hypothetical protein
MELDLAYIIVIVLLSIALIALIVHMLGTSTINRSYSHKHKRHWYPWNKNKRQQIGGCAGTKYGCCPNSQIPKLNALGTNC